MKGFSDDIGMEFRLSKCANATFTRGKSGKSDRVRLDKETMTKDLEQEKVYKYLGIDGSRGIQQELNSKSRITAIIMLAILVITYSFNIIDWNFSEVKKKKKKKKIDIKVKKMMTTHTACIT